MWISMALLNYFQPATSMLPKPDGPLSRVILTSSIAAANKELKKVLDLPFFLLLSCLHVRRVVLELIGPDLGLSWEKEGRSSCPEFARKLNAEFLDVDVINPARASHYFQEILRVNPRDPEQRKRKLLSSVGFTITLLLKKRHGLQRGL